MALVKFSQDDTQPFGTGVFVNDAGRSIYTSDPDGARAIPPTPPPAVPDAEPPAAPGTRVSYAGDTSSPYANAVASNEGATGAAAVGLPPGATGIAHDVAAKAASVVPPASAAAAPVVQGSSSVSPQAAAAKAAQVVKTSTTEVRGRKAGDVERQIGTSRAALNEYTGANEANAAKADERAVAGVDARIATRQAQETQLKEDAAQHAADQRAADERVRQFMDLPDGKEDPDRFMNSLSTGSKVALSVLAAISGFAQGVRDPHGPADLSVLNVLNRRVDQDIAMQKDQLAQGRLRKSNLIARAMAQGADAKQAEATARAQLWNMAADIGDLQAQRIGLNGAQAAAAKQQTDAMRYQAGVHEGDLRAQTESHIQTTTERQPGGAGGKDAVEDFAKKLATRKAYEESGATAEQLKAFDETVGVPTPGGESKFAGDKRKGEKPTEAEAKKGDAIATMQGLHDSLQGLPETVYTPESSSLPRRVAHAAGDFLLGEGSGEKYDMTLSTKDLKDSQKFTQARQSYLAVLSQLNGQGAMSDPEFRNNTAAAQAANSPTKLRTAIENALRARGSKVREEIQVEDR